MTGFVVVDTETTGVDPEVDRVCEIAAAAVLPALETGVWRSTHYYSSLVNPGRPIPPEASAVHHLTDDMVRGAPTLDEIIKQAVPPGAGGVVMVAHNAAFDSKFLPQLSKHQWLCTYRLAMHLWPDAPSHSNQALRYWRGLTPPFEKLDGTNPRNQQPHAALYDVCVTVALLIDILGQGKTVDELFELQDQPFLLSTVRFGKHRGQKWADVPRSYLDWVLKQDFDADVKHTARHYGGRE